MNTSGMELGEFTYSQKNNNNGPQGATSRQGRTGINKEDVSLSENGNNRADEENHNKLNEESHKNGQQTNSTSHANSQQMPQVNQSDSFSIGSTWHNCSFINNMNNNMQCMMAPLMLMIQHSQERAEERDQQQLEQEAARRIEEDQSCNDCFNVAILSILARSNRVDPKDVPRL
ncbi:hypothetical protein O181_025371 [Austropuccinia psidii MF-1]|uniref:Uncharacterized protein n=1 Tax=Austropuccinia psidii MF-1 TaxID=1389203 RepID=A0A9Q3CIE0_9BASI|nr:hypothetical protein [Austropuccinia psidii MF-1]